MSLNKMNYMSRMPLKRANYYVPSLPNIQALFVIYHLVKI